MILCDDCAMRVDPLGTGARCQSGEEVSTDWRECKLYTPLREIDEVLREEGRMKHSATIGSHF